MAKAPNPDDILRLGPQVAAIKASMPKKRWAGFVKLAHARGHTIGGELSSAPAALKERTASSLRAEAQKSIAAAYAPATKALSEREAAIGHLDAKRKTDDASYRQWLVGETEKLHAQAGAADATLASQQSAIAEETKTAIAAARADSIRRMAENPGGVSTPAISGSVEAADAASTQRIGTARDHTAALTKIGGDSRTLASASLLAQQAAREATRQGDTWKALSELATDRGKLKSDQAASTLSETSRLLEGNAKIVQGTREADLAGASLGLKQADSAQAIIEANRKFKLESAKFGLDKWKADNANKVAQARIDLGYDQLVQKEGQAAADRKLRERLQKLRLADKDAEKKKGVTKDERKKYDAVRKAQGLFTRWDKNNAVPLAEREQHLLELGFDAGVVEVAHDLARNNGVLSDSARVTARKLGIIHSGYFWPPAKSIVDYDKPTG